MDGCHTLLRPLSLRGPSEIGVKAAGLKQCSDRNALAVPLHKLIVTDCESAKAFEQERDCKSEDEGLQQRRQAGGPRQGVRTVSAVQ